MILLDFNFSKPTFSSKKFDEYRTITFGLGFLKIIWVNKKATGAFLSVVGLALSDFDSILKHEEYLYEIESLKLQLSAHDHAIANLKCDSPVE